MRIAIGLIVMTSCGWAAPLDKQPAEAYRWRVLVRTPNHPLFDAAFRANLARELKAALQPGLGLLGVVDVIDVADSKDADAIAFREQGWPALEASAAKPLDNHKHHGLVIDYRDGAFHVAARQFDGFTGMNTPLLRTRTVRSLDQIARVAGLLLEPDFAPAGTVEIIPSDAAHVMVALRAHTLAKLDDRVSVGDVFAVSLIQESKGVLTATQVAPTLLKVVEAVKGGKCKCRVLSRWVNPFGRDSRKAAAIRALRLPAITAPLKVQLVDRGGKPHARRANLTVTASDLDFTARPTASDGFEWRDGYYRSTRPFANIACFSVGYGHKAPQLFPVAVVSDDVITLAFNADPEAERLAEFLRDCSDLRARIADLSTAQVAMISSMNQLLDIAKNREALARAESGRDTIAGLEKALAEELNNLTGQPGASDAAAKDVLDASARQLIAVKNGQTQLVGTITLLKEAISKAADPSRIEKEIRGQTLADRIKDCLTRGDVPEALEAYDKLIELYPADATHKDAREKLKADWVPKDEAHRVARDCIRTLAAAKKADEFKTACEAVRKAVPVMARHKDRLGLRKLTNTIESAIVAFRTLVGKTDGVGLTPEQQAELIVLDELATEIHQCSILVREALREMTAAEKK